MKIYFTIITASFLLSCNSSSESNRGYTDKRVVPTQILNKSDTLFNNGKPRMVNNANTNTGQSGTQTVNVQPAGLTAEQMQLMQQQQQQAQQQQIQQQIQQQMQQQQAAAGKGFVNPPHGQPGHVCGTPTEGAQKGTPIQVGNQKLVKQVNPTTTTITQPTTVKANNAPVVKTAPGMNPPHGEPNHRCDIAVGQPLSSKVQPINSANPIGDIVPKF